MRTRCSRPVTDLPPSSVGQLLILRGELRLTPLWLVAVVRLHRMRSAPAVEGFFSLTSSFPASSHCLPKSFAMCPETSDWLLGCNLPWLFTCHPHDVTTCSSDVRYDIKKSKWDTNLEITAILISFPGTHLFDWLTPNQNIYVYILDRYNHVRWHPSPHPIPPFFVKKVSENSLTQHLSKCFKHPDNRTKLTVYSRPPSIVSLLET